MHWETATYVALHCASAPEHTHCTDTTLNLCKSTDVNCFAPGAPQFGLTKSLTATLAVTRMQERRLSSSPRRRTAVAFDCAAWRKESL